MSIWSLNCQRSVFKSAIIVRNVSRSFTYKMATKVNWHRYGTNVGYVTVALCIVAETMTQASAKLNEVEI